MKIKKTIFYVFGFFLLAQFFFFYDYLTPFHWRQIKVKGLACTCPDESVVSGTEYLKSITPDSLKKYDLDYSEIFVTGRPCSKNDPMGVGYYFIKGVVEGKSRVNYNENWNPRFRVTKWREADPIIDYGYKGFFLIQLIGWLIALKLIRKK